MSSGFGMFLGLEAAKGNHHAEGLDTGGKQLHDTPRPTASRKPWAVFDTLARPWSAAGRGGSTGVAGLGLA